MSLPRIVLVLCLVLASFRLWAAPAAVAIVGATVIHPERDGEAAIERDVTVVIEGERIKAVGPSREVKAPAAAQIIDGKGKWVVPGLVDGHIHFFQSGNLYTRPDGADFNKVVP